MPLNESEMFEIPRLPGGKIDLGVREQILSRHMEGATQKQIAEEFGISMGGVRGVIKSDERASKIRDNKIDYDGPNRIRVLNKAFALAETMLERCTDEFRLKSLVDSINILVHTRRIEEGLTGAGIADMKPFTMNVLIASGVKEAAAKEDFPELSAGDMVVEANPVETTTKAEEELDPFA